MKKATKKDYIDLANWYMDYANEKDNGTDDVNDAQFGLAGDFWPTVIDTEAGEVLTNVKYLQTCRNVASALYSEAQTL
jgi:hypothetical protein